MCVKVFFLYSHHHLTHKKNHHHINAHFHHKEQNQTFSDRFTRPTHGKETVNCQRAEEKLLNFQNKMDLHWNGFSSTEWLSIVNLIAIKCFQPGINIICCTLFRSIAPFLCRPQCIPLLAPCIILVRTEKIEKKNGIISTSSTPGRYKMYTKPSS